MYLEIKELLNIKEVITMKVGGKQGLSRNQFHALINSLAEIAREYREAKQEEEKEEGNKNEKKKN
jgi:hypothetical protein